MKSASTVWFAHGSESAHAHQLLPELRFDADGPTTGPANDATHAHLFAVDHPSGVAAALLLPSNFPEVVERDGVLLAPGMHPLRHAQSLGVGSLRIWISSQGTPEEFEFEPEQHGDDVHCFRTKARLRPGDAVVRCPGTPDAPCGRLFRAAAWGLALPCHGCGFDPAQPTWTPPITVARKTPDELLTLIRKSCG